MRTAFKVYGQPEGKARPRFTRQGRVYTPAKTKSYELAIARAFLGAGGKCFHDAVIVEISAYYRIPKSTTKTQIKEIESGRKRPLVKPDIDNVIKIVLDGLNKVAFDDDKQVIGIVTRKIYGLTPRIEVEVYDVEEECNDQKKNYNIE